jgi:hypothetical protein
VRRLALFIVLLSSTIQTSAQTPVKGKGATGAVERTSPSEITKEQAFYYWVAAYGAPADVVDRYARVFDLGNYERAMADEFERRRYREQINATITARVRDLEVDDRFLYLSERKPHLAARLGEYSFADHAFPVKMPNTGFGYFNYWVRGNGFDINPFDLPKASNLTDFDWSLPMPEDKASALLKSLNNRQVTLAIIYSITRATHEVHSLRYYLTPFIYSIEVFADRDRTRKIATLARRPSAPRSPAEKERVKAEAARTRLMALETNECSEGEYLVSSRSQQVFVLSPSRTCWTPWLIVETASGGIQETGNVLLQVMYVDGSISEPFQDGPKMNITLKKQIRKARFKSLGSEAVTVTFIVQ